MAQPRSRIDDGHESKIYRASIVPVQWRVDISSLALSVARPLL